MAEGKYTSEHSERMKCTLLKVFAPDVLIGVAMCFRVCAKTHSVCACMLPMASLCVLEDWHPDNDGLTC